MLDLHYKIVAMIVFFIVLHKETSLLLFVFIKNKIDLPHKQ